GRMTNVELAERVGLTAPPCLRRVRALEQQGAITGYHAALDPAALGYNLTVFAMVSLKSQAEADLRAFEQMVADIPEVRECHMLNGE
ncbi:Lrp/AsnC family transcriptional regulator, partial [Acinetobacter baumannii]